MARHKRKAKHAEKDAQDEAQENGEAQQQEQTYEAEDYQHQHDGSAEQSGEVLPGGVERIDVETSNYFRQLEGVLDKNEFPSDEDKQIFLDNVFSEMNEKEPRMSVDRKCSKLLEKMLLIAPHDKFTAIFARLCERFSELAFNPYSSHVLQSMLNLAPNVANKQDDAEADTLTVAGTMSALCDSLSGTEEGSANLVGLMTDACGSHVARALLMALAGRVVDLKIDELGKRNKNKQRHQTTEIPFTQVTVPASFEQSLQNLVRCVESSAPDVLDNLCYDTYANPVLQLVLTLIHADKEKEKTADRSAEREKKLLALNLVSRMLHFSEGDLGREHCNQLMQSQVGSHLMETLLQAVTDELFVKIYSFAFRGNLFKLSLHHVSNYVVQRLFTACRHSAQVNMIVEELLPHIATLLAKGKANVVWRMVQACATHKASQKVVLKGLSKAVCGVGSSESKKFVNQMLYLETLTQHLGAYSEGSAIPDVLSLSSQLPKLSGVGCSMLQSCLFYEPDVCKTVSDGIRSLDDEVLFKLATDTHGSRVIDAFLEGNTKSLWKQQLVDRFKGRYAELALQKFGGFCIEKLYKVSELSKKSQICSELLAKEAEIKATFHGKFVWRNCRMDSYQRKREEWTNQAQKTDKARERFADILGTDDSKGKSNVKSTLGSGLQDTMDQLGFGGAYSKKTTSGDEPKAERTKKDKKNKKSKPDLEADLTQDPELGKPRSTKEIEMAVETGPMDEIDVLFKKKNRGNSKSGSARKAAAEVPVEDPMDTTVTADLVDVMDAIQATTRKGTKKVKKRKQDEKEQASPHVAKKSKVETDSTSDVKKKKKFAMN